MHSAGVSLSSCCLFHSALNSKAFPPLRHLPQVSAHIDTRAHTQPCCWRWSKETCSLFCPLSVTPGETPALRNTRPAASSVACQIPIQWPSSAQMLWQRAWASGPVWCCDSTITFASSANSNTPTGICFGVTENKHHSLDHWTYPVKKRIKEQNNRIKTLILHSGQKITFSDGKMLKPLSVIPSF